MLETVIDEPISDMFEYCNKIFDRCAIFAEASFQEYENDIMSADLMLEKAECTDDEYQTLIQEAEDNTEERSKNIIKKIFDTMIQTIKKICSKIKSIFTKDKIKKVEEEIEKNDMGAITVSIIDYKELEKADNEYDHEVSKAEALARHGKDVDGLLSRAAETHSKKVNKAIKTTISVSLIAAIGIITGLVVKSEKDSKRAYAYDVETGEKIQVDVISPKDASDRIFAQKNKINVAAHRARCEVAKFMHTNTVLSSIGKFINKILGRGGEVDPDIKNMKPKKNTKPKTESVIDDVSIDNPSEYIDSLIESVETEFDNDIGFVDNVVNILENSI